MLADQKAATVNRLGIRNERYGEDSQLYGIPNPGIVLVDADGTVLLKRAKEKYSERPALDELVTAVAETLSDKSKEPAGDDESMEGVDTS